MPLPDIPVGIQKKIDSQIEDILAELKPLQDTYFETNGKYFQGLKTHVVTPADGNKSAPDKSRKPSDQIHDWNDFGITKLASTMDFSVAIDVYQSPSEWGATLRSEIVIAGRQWMKVVLVRGTDTGREFDWTDVTFEDGD